MNAGVAAVPTMYPTGLPNQQAPQSPPRQEDQMARITRRSTALDAPQVSLELWREDGPEDDRRWRLLSTLVLNGCPLHVEALGAHTRDDGIYEHDYEGAEAWPEEMFDGLYRHFGSDGAQTTITIEGREYAVFASPYC